MEQRKPVRKVGAVLTAGLLLLAVLGISTALERSGGSLGNLLKAAPPAVLGVLAATAVTYAVMSVRFRVLSGLSGISLPARMLHELGFASSIMGRVVVGGGMASNVLRVISLRRHNVPVADTAAVSVAHGYVNFLGVGLALAAAIACLAFVASVSGAQVAGAIVSLTLLLVVIALLGWTLLDGAIRQKVSAKVAQATGFVVRRDFSGLAERFDRVMGGVIASMRRDPALARRVVVMVVVENVAATVALWSAFAAFGVSLTPWEVLAIYGLSTAAGAVSMLPGGLGVQDGSITGVAMVLGVPGEAALMAALLFRVLHFFLPFTVSLVLYRKLLSEVEGEAESARAAYGAAGGAPAMAAAPALSYAEALRLDVTEDTVPDRGASLGYVYERPSLTAEHGRHEPPATVFMTTVAQDGDVTGRGTKLRT